MVINKWVFVYSEGHSLIKNGAWFVGFTDFSNVPGMLNDILYINRDGLQICYTTQEELDRVKEEGKVFFNETYQKKFKKAIDKCINNFIMLYDSYKTMNLRKLTNKELLCLFNKYIECECVLLAHYQVGGGRSFPLLEKYVKDGLVKQFSESEFNKNCTLLLSSHEIDILEKEEISLLDLGLNPSDEVLLEHANNYSFQFYNTYEIEIILNFLKERSKKLNQNYGSSKNYLEKKNKRKKLLLNEQKKQFNKIKNKKLKNLILFLREQGKLRLEYKEWKAGEEYKFLELFREISRRIGISLKEYLSTYKIEDTQLFLNKGKTIELKERDARKKIFVYFQKDGKKQFASGNKAEYLVEKILGKSKNKLTELKGISASSGKVTGKIRIILPIGIKEVQEDMKHFEEGDILVTTMTQPNILLIMKKASAIITDQGGMTSHAAVISRELGVPCIVGTYNATRILNNGDLVEVDADNGVIKIIKKSNN
ncbi:hypothetical protein HOC35_00760 [Candidatus Woesearchaeota archaeon]|nr:hypothetical protein [Candidatus Woesearchaeota archaeon]